MKPAPEFPVDAAPSGSTESPIPVNHSSIPDDLWKAVQTDYRSGLTYSALSEKFHIPIPAIVARRRAHGWRKDLREDVKAETFGRLAADSVPLGSSPDDEAVVQAAAQQGVAVIRRHRVVLHDTIQACSLLAAQLLLAAQNKAPAFEFLGPKETMAEAALKIGNALARTVPLERVAYGLNDRQEEKPYEERLREFYASQRALRTKRAQDRKREAKKEADSAIREASHA